VCEPLAAGFRRFPVCLGFRSLFGEIVKQVHVIHLAGDAGVAFYPALVGSDILEKFLGGIPVVPEAGLGGLFFEFGYLRLASVEVKETSGASPGVPFERSGRVLRLRSLWVGLVKAQPRGRTVPEQA